MAAGSGSHPVASCGACVAEPLGSATRVIFTYGLFNDASGTSGHIVQNSKIRLWKEADTA
jgi:hypothetical protein